MGGAAVLISISEYLSTSYRPDCDYVDGELVERTLGELDHSKTQIRIASFFFARQNELGVWVFTELRIQVKPTRFRVPDVCVTLEEPQEQILTHPPFLCIEVLSKDDAMSRMNERIQDYLEFGVPHVWVLDPRTKQGFHYTLEGMTEAKDGLLHAGEIAVPLAEVFDNPL